MSLEFSIFAAARAAPHRVALIVEGRSFTFRELAERVATTLTWLENRGVTRSDGATSLRETLRASDLAPVAVIASSELSTLLLVYALLELGVPFALLHPRLTEQERAEQLAVIGARQVFAAPDLLALSTLPPSSFEGSVAPEIALAWPLAIVLTSGTSGTPRAALLSHGAFHHAVAASAANLGWDEADRWLLCLPVCHVGGLSIVLRCLAARAGVVLAHAQGERDSLDLTRVVDAISRDGVTLLSLVPTLLERLLDTPDFELPNSVRAILLGGAACSTALLNRAADLRWPILTTYGLTETCSQLTTQPYGSSNRGELGAGRPGRGARVRIAADAAVEVNGPSLFSGYLTRNGIERPFDAAGWFRTADRGFLDEHGYLHVLGRSSELIVTGGENVYPSEVERALEQYPGVAGACVFGVDDARWGQAVAALLVGSVELGAELAAHLKDRLAPHKRPRLWAKASELPTTALGKLDRAAAARLYAGKLHPAR